MRHPWRGLMQAQVMSVTVLALLGTTAPAANEAALGSLWQQHLATPDQHDALITACRQFVAKNASDPLIPVAQGIETWHLLKSDRKPEALALLDTHLKPGVSAPSQGAAILTRAWLSRLDLGAVHQALRLYYRREVRYPERLDVLAGFPGIPADQQPRLTDRWDRPWIYRLTGFKSSPGFRDQRYALSSGRLADTSDLTVALALPYASLIHAQPARLGSTQGGNTIVEFTDPSATSAARARFMIGTGSASSDLFLAYVGDALIIVCDHTHWKVFAKPRPTGANPAGRSWP